jgi:hypothetical protein
VVEGMALVHRVLLHNLSRMMILHLKAMLGEKFIGEIYHCSPRCLRGWEWPISMERGGRVVFSIPACVFFVSSHAYESHGIFFARFHLSPTQHSFTTIINTALI